MELYILIMAGGLGKRMQSTLPKVLHNVNGVPMLVKIIREVIQLDYKKIFIIVGKYREIIEKTLHIYFNTLDFIDFINQSEPLGTGHAIISCHDYLSKLSDNATILILSGDVPLIKKETILVMIEKYNKIKIMTTSLDNPFGNGRIIRNADGIFEKIIEEKDCNEEEKKIKEVNCGIYVFENWVLCKYLKYLDNNNTQSEYYLTDIVEIIKKNEKIDIESYHLSREKQYELTNINTKEQLEKINSIL